MSPDQIAKLSEKTKAGLSIYTQSETLRDKVFLNYSYRVLNRIDWLIAKNPNPENLAAAFTTFLKKNWVLVQQTCLSPTAIANSELAELLCYVAEYTAHVKKEDKLCALQLLMPGVSLESLNEDYPDLENLSIQNVLKEFILGENSLYLLPVALLKKLDLSNPDPLTEMYNPYFDYEKHDEDRAKVSPVEFKRLIEHSKLTQHLGGALARYQALCQDKSNLLGQLKQLCRYLSVNSVGEQGSEVNAGAGAYAPIIAFNDYYQQLSMETKGRIPETLKKEIDTLLQLSSDPTANTHATSQLETCIATRRSNLMTAMQNHEPLLSTISIDEAQKATLVGEVIEEFQATQMELIDALDKPNYYQGADKLPLTIQLITTLKISISFNSPADIALITTLSVEEMDSLLTNQAIRAQMISQLHSLEDLVIFLTEQSPEKMKILLTHCTEEITQQFIQNANDLNAALISLTPEKCSLLYAGLYNRVIHTTSDFPSVLRNLDPEQLTAVCEAMKTRLPEPIKTATDFGNVLYFLSLEQITAVCNAVKDSLPGIIKTADDFNSLISDLSAAQITAVCNAVKDSLPGIIKTADDFNSLISDLSAAQITIVCEAMKDSLPELIKTASDFCRVLYLLSPAQITIVCEAMKDSLPGLIETADDFNIVLRYLSPAQITAVCEAMKDSLPGLIKTAIDFCNVLKHLSPAQITAVYEAMKARLPKLLKTAHDLSLVLYYLKPAQITAVCEAMKARLPKLIKTAFDFGDVLRYLNSAQITVVCGAMKASLPKLINTASGFGCVLYHLSPEEQTAVYEAMKEQLPKIIHTQKEFDWVIVTIETLEQKISLYFTLLKKHPSLDLKTIQLMPNDKEPFFRALSSLHLATHCLKAYESLWTASIKANAANVDPLLLKAGALLDDYTKSNSALKRVAFFHWNRHHCHPVAKIVRQIKNGEIESIDELQNKIFEIMQESQSLNLKGSLVRRLKFIIQKCDEQALSDQKLLASASSCSA